MSLPPLIPRDVLFGNPTRVSPRISPDGKRLAYIAPAGGVLNVWVGTVGGDDFRPVTRDTDRGIREFLWAHDNRHILHVQDQGGDENWRIFRTDLETGETVDLTPFDGVQAQFVEVSKHHPHEVIVGLNRDNPQLHDAYRVDLRSGELTKVADNPGFVGWLVDPDLRVRGGIQPRPDGGMAILVRDDEAGEWRPVHVVGPEDALTTDALTFAADGRSLLLVTSKDANTARLARLDLASGALDVLAEDPSADVAGAIVHPDTREPQAVGYLRDRVDWQVLDRSIEPLFETIRSLHSGDPAYQGRDHADRTWLVGYNTDAGPVPYYAIDRETGEATFLFVHRPELEQYELAPMEPFSFQARDGLTVHGYLTFPPGLDRRNLPTVLNVHGGPWARDVWGLNVEAQWLANRGYLCVQVNYRGSVGYGKAFVNAGDREWGGRMHDDLIDAVEWVIDHGSADRERVAIYGGSYGGYAALVGTTFTPDVFRCAVDIVGPSNLKTFIETIPPYWVPMISLFHTRVGNPETEEEFLWSRSPLSRVDEIKVPLLIAQGANDPRVKQSESEQIVAALKDKGIAHDYMLFPDEGHGFAKPENRLRFYAAAERFLAEHLGGRAEG